MKKRDINTVVAMINVYMMNSFYISSCSSLARVRIQTTKETHTRKQKHHWCTNEYIPIWMSTIVLTSFGENPMPAA